MISKHFPQPEAETSGTHDADTSIDILVPPNDVDWYTWRPSDLVWLYEVKGYVPGMSRYRRRRNT